MRERRKSALFGFVTCRERWGLSLRGVVALLLFFATAAVVVVRSVHPFLSLTHRVPSDFFVVEGWMQEHSINAAAQIITNAPYQKVFTTGGPVPGAAGTTNPYSTSASVAAGRLKAVGLPADRVQMVPSFVRERDRTYSSALALRDYFFKHRIEAKRINVITVGVHARRSRDLFQKAFGDAVEVGVISIPSGEYDATHWWRYSEGVKEVVMEVIAYTYAAFVAPD